MAPDVEICKICEVNFVVSKKVLCCGICDIKVHPSCVSVKENWLKGLNECDNIMWLCDVCHHSARKNYISFRTEDTILQKEVDCLKREIEITKKLLTELEYTNNLQKSILKSYEMDKSNVVLPQASFSGYSQAVKNPPPKKSSTLLIKAAEEDHIHADNIMKEVTSSVKPANLNICINSTRKIKNGVAIHCNDDKSLNVLKDSLDQKLGSKYSITESKMLNPRMLIRNVNLDGLNTPDEIINNIIVLNTFTKIEKTDIKFVTKLDYVNNTNLVIEVTSILRNALLKEGFVFIGWKKSPIFDHVRVLKCFKCCSFGHKANVCKCELICPNCTRNHKLKECKCNTSAFQCINCLNYNKLNKKNFPTDHSSNFSGCRVYQAYVDNLKSKINYE